MSFFIDTPGTVALVQHETREVIAFISVYEVDRCYGGPEEGGWWYDSYEWLKVAIPFRAVQDYRLVETDEEDGSGFKSMQDYSWEPFGRPRPADFQAQVQLDSFRILLASIYGEEGGKGRYSVIGAPDLQFVIERNPGELGERPRPRYE